MSSSGDVKALDPGLPAPPVDVEREPSRDMVGHGRVLPLVGGSRPHQYDVVYADGTRRVYADTPGGVLSAVIPGYEETALALAEAESEAERLLYDESGVRVENVDPHELAAARDKVQAAFADAFVARADHATELRMRLQQQENAHAAAEGTWDGLDDEGREQCEASARGEVPVGVIYQAPDDDGSIIERGFWPFPVPRLVISKGDYGLFVPEGTEEPESMVDAEFTDDEATGFDAAPEFVPVVRFPRNMIILDPTEESLYMESLEVAGVIEVEVRPVDLADDIYTSAVETGAEMREAGEEGGVSFT